MFGKDFVSCLHKKTTFLNLAYVITSKTVTSDEIVFSLFCLYILIYKKYNYFHEIWLIVNKLVKQWQFRKFDNSTLWIKKKSNKPTNHRLCVWNWTESFALAEIYSSPFISHGCDKDCNSVACALRATHHQMWYIFAYSEKVGLVFFYFFFF